MAYLTKETLGKPVALKEAVVEVLGGQVKLRQLTSMQLMEQAIHVSDLTGGGNGHHVHQRETLIYRAMLNESGDKLFFDSFQECCDFLGKQPNPVVLKLYNAANELNGETLINEDNITDAAKNSETAASENSSSLQPQ